MEIKKLLTPYNHNTSTIDRVKYIVIHYVGALGGAKANCQWYAGADRGASAHYFVDFDGSVWQSVEDRNIAWHCGAKSYKHPECRNANSIGIEMCVRNKGNRADTSRNWYFEDATVRAAIRLTRELMARYSIPADHVIRHYDVTGKICPNPYVYNTTRHTWTDFRRPLPKRRNPRKNLAGSRMNSAGGTDMTTEAAHAMAGKISAGSGIGSTRTDTPTGASGSRIRESGITWEGTAPWSPACRSSMEYCTTSADREPWQRKRWS